MSVCLQALFCLKVEELQRPTLRLQSNDRFSQVHDGTICANWSADNIVCVLQVDDDGLGGGVGLVVDLAYANVFVGLKRLWQLSASSLTPTINHKFYIHSFAMISMLAVNLVSLLPLDLDLVGSLV